MNPDDLLCLVFRMHTGCRQYAFTDAEALAKWCARKPYRHELVGVAVCFGGRMLSEPRRHPVMPAPDVPSFVADQRAAAASGAKG